MPYNAILMISITIEQQNFEIKDLFALEGIIQNHPASTQEILNKTFSKPSECGYLISNFHNLEHLQSLVPDFMPTLYNIIVNTDDLLGLHAKSTITVQRFVKFFEHNKDDIYYHLAIRSNLLSRLLKQSALLEHIIECVNTIFPNRRQTTLDILLKDKNLVCLKYLSLLVRQFPEQERYLYKLVLNSANSLEKFIQSDDDYESILDMFPNHKLLLSYLYPITKGIIQNRMDTLFEINHTFNSIEPEQDYFKIAKLLNIFIQNSINELSDTHSTLAIKEVLRLLQTTIVKYLEKDNLTNLCINAMKRSGLFKWDVNQNDAKHNLLNLPVDLQNKYDPSYIATETLVDLSPQKISYTSISTSKNM